MQVRNKNDLLTYCCGIKNELRRDIFMHDKLELYKYGSIIIPRAEKIFSWFQKRSKYVYYFISLTLIIWSKVLYPILLSGVFVKNIFKIKGNKWSHDERDLFIVTSPIGLDAVKKLEFDGYYLFLSSSQLRAETTSEKYRLLTDYCTFKDLWLALRLAYTADNTISKTVSIEGAVLQNYTAFSWFLTWLVLSRISNKLDTLWFTNDSDRWAVLFDNLPGRLQRILVQHGLLADHFVDKVRDRPSEPLPCKLKNITRIYVYDEKSKILFQKMILDGGGDIDYQQFPMTLNLVDWPPNINKYFRILIIGQPEATNSECKLTNEILSCDIECDVIIKPHPSYSSKPYECIDSSHFYLLDRSDIFPNADVVIMFADSSLGRFYESSGIKTISVNKYLEEDIVKLINSLYIDWLNK